MQPDPNTAHPGNLVRTDDGSMLWPFGYSSYTTAATAICPDLLSIRNIGEADGWRGHVVRGFFRLLKVISGV